MQLVQENITQLRTGCCSEILLVQRGDLQFVLKAVESSAAKQVCHLLNEWTVLSQVQHPNIVNVMKCLKKVTIPGKEGIYYLLAQEFAKHGNLSQLVRRKLPVMSFANRRFLFWQLTQAIDHLHSNNVVHRDLKLDNILVFQNEQGLALKIADFGFAKILTKSEEMIGSYKGTKRGYMAPEIHQCKENTKKTYDGKAADMFALGVILFALVMGRLPFQFAIPEDRNYKLLMENPSEFWANLNPLLVKLQQTQGAMVPQFKNLFEGLVKYDPKQRLKIGEVLQHGWLLGQKQQMSV